MSVIHKVKNEITNTIASNNNPLYRSHLYWSQKPYNITDILIENFSKDSDTIFDPFMGSGVTLIQAMHSPLNRKAIGVDINDVPIFIIDTLLNNYNLDDIKKTIDDFLAYSEKLNEFYATDCKLCGNTAYVSKTIFDRENYAQEIYLKEIHYNCSCTKKSLKKKSNHSDSLKQTFNYQLENINDIQLIRNSRLAVHENQKISSLFTSRNMYILDKLVGYINNFNGSQKDALQYILLSIIHLSKITDTHSNSQWPLWTPKKNCVEKNIVNLVKKRSNYFLKAIEYVEKNTSSKRKKAQSFEELENGDYLILKKGIQYIGEKELSTNSVDLIITDPPYLGQVLYSEYMQLYQPFLNLNFNLEDEIVVSTSPERKKKEDDYYTLIEEGFQNIGRVLKENSYMCMYFHDSNLRVWCKLISILERAGLRYISQVHVKKKNTLKNIISPKKSLNGDAILFFIKEKQLNYERKEVENIEEMEFNIILHAKTIIKQHGPQTTPQLYDDGLMEMIIHNGWLEQLSKAHKSLVEIFEIYLIWDSDACKWTI